MSKRIDDVISVLREIRNRYNGERGIQSIRALRIVATEQVAARRQVVRGVIDDALRRRLHLKSVPRDFDPLVVQWLGGDVTRLQEVMQRAALDDVDLRAIAEVMRRPSGPSNAPAYGSGTPKRPSSPTKRKLRRAASKQVVTVILDTDVAEVFPTAKAVNDALRSLIDNWSSLARRASK